MNFRIADTFTDSLYRLTREIFIACIAARHRSRWGHGWLRGPAPGLSQGEFAKAMGVSVRTLQAWEQGRRQPSGAARTPLKIAARHPRVLREAVAS
jgi:DNA-binding XRE family transcriptional regulator